MTIQFCTFKRHGRRFRFLLATAIAIFCAGADKPSPIPVDVCTLTEWRTLINSRQDLCAVSFSPDGRSVASAGGDSLLAAPSSEHAAISLWDPAASKKTGEFKGHTRAVTCLRFSSDGKTLFSGSHDWTLRVWDVPSRTQRLSLQGHKWAIGAIALLPGDKRCASGSGDHRVMLWDLEKKASTASHDMKEGVTSLVYSTAANCLFAATTEGRIAALDPTNLSELASWQAHQSRISGLVIHPDGNWLMSASYDSTIRIWDVRTRQELAVLSSSNEMSGIVLACGGKGIITCDSWGRLYLWSLQRKTLMLKFTAHPFAITGLSSSGSQIASISMKPDEPGWDQPAQLKVWHVSLP